MFPVAKRDLAGPQGCRPADIQLLFKYVQRDLRFNSSFSRVTIKLMENFRQFDAGPDPFGHAWKVKFKWLQTAISLRHSDTIDVKFVILDDSTRAEKTIALPHADLLALCQQTGRPMTDAWCSRLAALHVKHLVETGEDMEKDLVTVSPEELAAYDAQLATLTKNAA